MDMNELKKQSAVEAVKQIKSGDVVGLGTGSTAYFAVEEVGRLLKEGILKNIVGVATSIETDTHVRFLWIPDHHIPIRFHRQSESLLCGICEMFCHIRDIRSDQSHSIHPLHSIPAVSCNSDTEFDNRFHHADDSGA